MDLGAEFVLGMILSLITVDAASALVSYVAAVSSFSASAVRSIESWDNGTNSNGSVRDTRKWGTIAGLVGLSAGLVDSPIALGMLSGELFPPEGVLGSAVTAVVALGLGAAVIGPGIYLLTHPDVLAGIALLVLSFFAVIATAYHF